MKKILILATISILLSLLLLGIFSPMSYPMLFAATTQNYVLIRAGLIILLLSLLVYKPPREPIIRSGLALVGTMLWFASMSILVSYEMKVLDSLVLLETAILLYIEAAEISVAARPEGEQRTVSKVAQGAKVRPA